MTPDHVKQALQGIDYAYQKSGAGFYYYMLGAVIHALLAIAQAIREKA